jgi:hypothetical protein
MLLTRSVMVVGFMICATTCADVLGTIAVVEMNRSAWYCQTDRSFAVVPWP